MASIFYCIKCAWFQGGGKCAAFPNGIPKEIKEGVQPHDTIIGGQEGDYTFTLPKDVVIQTTNPGDQPGHEDMTFTKIQIQHKNNDL